MKIFCFPSQKLPILQTDRKKTKNVIIPIQIYPFKVSFFYSFLDFLSLLVLKVIQIQH